MTGGFGPIRPQETHTCHRTEAGFTVIRKRALTGNVQGLAYSASTPNLFLPSDIDTEVNCCLLGRSDGGSLMARGRGIWCRYACRLELGGIQAALVEIVSRCEGGGA